MNEQVRAEPEPTPARDVSRETAAAAPAPPPVALEVFDDRLDLAHRFAGLLAGPGVERGLIGPRETPRLWERHLVNCALVAQVIPQGARLADLGSGAGLPGLVLALLRPDLLVTLVEPLLRRSVFLQEAVDDLGLAGVTVRRARAEELHGQEQYDVVTARALAPLARLVTWAMPLVEASGELVAMKGSSAQSEIDAADAELRRAGCAPPRIEVLSSATGSSTATVVRVARRVARPVR